MEPYIIETKNLSRHYQKFCALDQVTVTVKRGEIYGLVGDNGAGKSTFLKLLAGQIFPDGGELLLFGRYQKKELNEMRARIGTIIEAPGFYPGLTVEQNLEYYRIQKGVPGKSSLEEALEMTGMIPYRKKPCKALSLGMKQRLGLAAALLGVPELLLLDEPVNGLDPSGIIEMRNLLLRLNREKNITILLSSHILSELEHVATTYGFLQNGQILEQISAKELHARCEDYVEIRVSNPEKYAAVLEQRLGQTDFRIMPDRAIRIFHADSEIETYSRLAADNDINLLGLGRYQQTLEDYYMNLKNGGKRS